MQVFPKPPIPEIPHLKRAFLQQEKAITWNHAFTELCEWVSQEVTTGMIPVFISHNTFRADKPIMELECERYKLRLPSSWYFFDSLHYSRDIIKNSDNYSLSGLHENIFNAPIQNVHRARSDVSACVRILVFLTKATWDLHGPMYPAYFTSLRSIRWVGRKTEKLLYTVGVNSAESLFMLIQQNIHNNYIQQGVDEHTSIENTLKSILVELPPENIKNITNVLTQMCTEKPFSFTFMLKAE